MMWCSSIIPSVIAFFAFIVPIVICIPSQTRNRTLISNDFSNGGVRGTDNKRHLILGKQAYVAPALRGLFYNAAGQPLNLGDSVYEELVICSDRKLFVDSRYFDYYLCPTDISGSVYSYGSLLNGGLNAKVYCCTISCCTKSEYEYQRGNKGVPGWLIAVIVVSCVLFIAVIVGGSIICCCILKCGLEMCKRSQGNTTGAVIGPNRVQYAHATAVPGTTATFGNAQSPGYVQTGAAYGASYGQSGAAYGTGYGQTGATYGAGYGQTGAAYGAGYGQTGAAYGAGYGQAGAPSYNAPPSYGIKQ